MSIFKPCDIRGRYGPELEPGIAGLIGRAVGSELTGRAVAVGGDVRPSTGPLKETLIAGLVAAGCEVLDCGILPTPAFHFAKAHFHTAGGVMVTGSHNPAGDNGFKISLGPESITETEMARIRDRVERRDFLAGPGVCRAVEVTGPYEDFLRAKFPPGAGRKVVVDAGNGCYWRIAPRVLRANGCEVVELFCAPDGSFPNRDPNPSVAKHLGALRESVLATGADLGIAFDGDGDRVVFVDAAGEVIPSDVCIVLFARHLLAKEPGVVVHDIKCSGIVADEVRRLGGTPVMERSGHAFIRNTLLRRRAVLGGEISGHFFFGDLGWDDGLYAGLLLLRILRAEGRGLAALAADVPGYCITPDLRLPCPAERAREIVQELEQTFRQVAGCEVSVLDGVRIAWADGWALARPSVTEPLLTMRFEARTEPRLAEIRAELIARVPRLREILT
jgi:phosphomannomutase/phosphoglucomutase